MTMKRDRSRALYETACELIPGGVNSPVRAFRQVGGEPVYFRRAHGSRLWDEDGNGMVDWCQSWGPLILGHGREEVVEAVCDAAQDGLSFGACHRRELELARMVLQAFPEFEKVRLVSSGTEAVMTALRIARGVTGRNLILKFEGGYHGHSDGLLVKAGSGLATQAIASSAGVPEAVAGATLVATLDDEESVRRHFEAFGRDIAAVVIEPLPANNGLLVQRPEFLGFLREITRQYGALLIFDEVISGFRLRFGGYGQLAGIVPDLVTLGKIIGGGMPVGAIVGSARVMDVLAPVGRVYQAGTLSGNPVSLAAGIATLRILRDDPPYERLEQLGLRLEASLAAGGHPHARLCRVGSIAWFYLDSAAFPRRADAISDPAMERFKRLYWPLADAGHYLPPSSYEVLFISAAHSEEEVDDLGRCVAEGLAGLDGDRG